VRPNTAPPGGNGGTTDIGVTGNSITLGNISTLTGPVPGLFAGAVNGTDAFFAYQNSQGGVFGRQLKLNASDDQFDCGQNRGNTQSDMGKDFAFVGSFSLFDNCGAQVMGQNPGVSDVHVALSKDAQAEANGFSPSPLRNGAATGPFQYVKAQHPDAIASAGSLVGDVQSAKDAWVGEKATMESLGYHFNYERVYEPTETDFTADIVQMKSKGVKTVVLIAADVKGIARIQQAAQQQNWRPEVWLLGASAYDSTFIPLAGSAAEGSLIYLPPPCTSARTRVRCPRSACSRPGCTAPIPTPTPTCSPPTAGRRPGCSFRPCRRRGPAPPDHRSRPRSRASTSSPPTTSWLQATQRARGRPSAT
jgi:hypothetical protein